MNIATFQELVGQEFKVTFSEEHEYMLTLAKVLEGNPIPELELEPYTLEFIGDVDSPVYSQGSFVVNHEKLGDMTLFLIPRQPDKNGIYYDCIVS
ncbi:MAG: hypothetical protein HKO66_13560 [Saprospiraceae bacterium]|nr:hypothetical protein [Saprospiraceae bacterium]